MDFFGGIIGLYLIYFFGVLSLPYLFRAAGWALGYSFKGSLIALTWSGVHTGRLSVKAWWGFHRLRLGKDAYERRLQAQYYMMLVLMPGRERRARVKSWLEPSFKRTFILLRWRIEALYMQVLCLLLHKRLLLYYAKECRKERNRARAERREYEQAQREERARRESDDAETQAQEYSPKDVYDMARDILKLPEEFTEQELKHAYRRAMQWAHPDKGGTHEECLAVREARNYIKDFLDWQ